MKVLDQIKTNLQKNTNLQSNDSIKSDFKNKKIVDKNVNNSRHQANSGQQLIGSDSGDNSQSKQIRKQNFDLKMYGKEVLSYKSDPVKCEICNKLFENKTFLSKHKKIDHNSDQSIDESLPFPELVESKSVSEGRIKCGKCDFKTNSDAEMILHSINHSVISDNSRLKCPTCDRLLSKTLLKTHVFIHTSEKPFKCNLCQKEFMSRQSLLFHSKRHFPNVEPQSKCDICGIHFSCDQNFKKHLEIHRSDRQRCHSCEVCGSAFYEKESLKTHKTRVHLPKESRRFKCDFNGCRYICLYHHQLLEHQRTHSDDKPFACDLCQYTAKSKWSFKKHYRRHTNEKPFKCQVCDYATSLCSNLTRHMRIHTGAKPFKCPYCSYSCNNHENLRKHVLKSKKHKGLHLYNCKHCLFATNTFTDLRQHFEDKHIDIYSIEQIDRMISSFYHKNEDKTTIVEPIESDSNTGQTIDEHIKETNE